MALTALSTLFFEVLLTRIFSVTLWYHFGFLAISLALLGTAASAVLCYVFPDFLVKNNHPQNLWISACLFAIAAPAAVILHISILLPGLDSGARFYLIFGAQLTVFFLSFFFSGLCISIALFRYAGQVGRVYFFDLVGASLGSLLVVPFLYRWSPLALIFLVSAGACLAAMCFAKRAAAGPRLQTSLVLVILACLGLVWGNDTWGLLQIDSVKSYTRGSLQKTESRKIFEKWSPISRVAVLAPSQGSDPYSEPALWVTNDAGAPTFLIRFDGDFSRLESLKEDPLLAAYWLKEDADTLVVGSGGGRDVLAALASGQKKITAVDVNPLMEELVTDHFADYVGRIFDYPNVTFRLQEGRNFVASSPDHYDIILFTMIDSWSSAAAAGAYVFSENSLYTLNAVRDYVAHLKPDGLLSMTRYYSWGEGLRLTNMFVQYLLETGVSDIDKRIIVLRKPSQRPLATVLLKNGLFTPEEANAILQGARRGKAAVLHAPYLTPEDLAPPHYSGSFRGLIDPGSHGVSREQIVLRHARDISPPTDDRPFFFYTRRFSSLFQIDRAEHAARRLALPLLYAMVMVFGAIAILTVFLPLYLRSWDGLREAPSRIRSLTYFAMLGIGFMLIEISLIQRLTVFLGHPTWSFILVLSTLLFSSGLGSLFSARWPDPEPKLLTAAITGIVVLVLFYALVVYDQFIDLMWLGRPQRILLAVTTIVPAGFLMGMCFPMGIQIARRFHETLVPWSWGVNGSFSVFASILSFVLALSIGFKMTMLVGVACYAVALGIVASLRKVTA